LLRTFFKINYTKFIAESVINFVDIKTLNVHNNNKLIEENTRALLIIEKKIKARVI